MDRGGVLTGGGGDCGLICEGGGRERQAEEVSGAEWIQAVRH